MNQLDLASPTWLQSLPAITVDNKDALIALLWSTDTASIKALVVRDNGVTFDNLKILELVQVVGVKVVARALTPVLLDNPLAIREALQAASNWDISWLRALLWEYKKQNPEVPLWRWVFDARWESATAGQEIPDDVKSMNDLGDIHIVEMRWARVKLSQDAEELMNHLTELDPWFARQLRRSMNTASSGLAAWRNKHTPKTTDGQRVITGKSTAQALESKWPQPFDYV